MADWKHFQESSTALGAMVAALIAVLGFLGVGKFLVEPWQLARDLKKRYATGLWISCRELHLHLATVADQVRHSDTKSINSLKMLPNQNYEGRADWFAKEGYYATLTAYKIAVLSSWMQVYQQELLFSTVRRSRSFFGVLHEKGQDLKKAFSIDTTLWADYFDAVGTKLIDPRSANPRPMPFSTFCERYYADEQFRGFYEQLHMFIWFLADGKNLPNVELIRNALEKLMRFLEQEKLLSGMQIPM